MDFLRKLAGGDFAKGWKTLTGILILTFPFLASKFGIQLDTAVLEVFYSSSVVIAGGILTLYGLYAKVAVWKKKSLTTK